MHTAVFSGELAAFLRKYCFFLLNYYIKCCAQLYAPESYVSPQSLRASAFSGNFISVLGLFLVLCFLILWFLWWDCQEGHFFRYLYLSTGR